VSRECGWVAKLPSDELKSSKGLVEGGIQSVLATNPVVIQLRGTVGRAAAPGWREFGQAESECGKSDADIRLFTPIKCRVTTSYAVVLKGHRCLLAKVRNRPRTEQLPTGRAPSECTTAT